MRLPTAVWVVLTVVAVGPLEAAIQPCRSTVWSSRQQLATPQWISRLISIDYDHDGQLDLAGRSSDGNQHDVVLLWRGLGDGTFAAPTTLLTSNIQIGGDLADLAAGDVNGDGHPDLVVARWSTHSFLTYLGTGSGLAAPVETPASSPLTRISMGNFDADPALELVATSAGWNEFLVYDNASGTFTKTAQVATTDSPLSPVSADFNGDGIFDVAVTTRSSETEGQLEIHLRNANGTFASPQVLAGGSFPDSLQTADFNGDGRADLVLSNWYDSTLDVYLNDGAGGFASTTLSIDMPRRIGDAAMVLARDVSGDGVPDLIATAANGGWMTTFVAAGDGTFLSPTYYDPRDQQGWSLGLFAPAAGDFDGNGTVDVAVGASRYLVSLSKTCETQVTVGLESPLISSGQDAPVHVQLSGFGGTMAEPYGTVTVKEGDAVKGTATPDSFGRALVTVPGLAVGEHTFVAEFSGNAAVPSGASSSVVQTVTTTTTTVTIHTPQTPPAYGTDWPVTVSLELSGGGSPSGWYDLFVDGVAYYRYTSQTTNLRLDPGPHTIYAKFYGTQYLPASTSQTLNVTAVKATPAVTVPSSSTAVRLGQSHVLQFTVSGPAGAATPTGNVYLYSGATPIGGGALTNGTTTIGVTLPRGAHEVRATYAGDGYYAATNLDLTLSVLPDQPIALDARGLTNAIHVAWVAPAGTNWALYRRVAGSGTWTLASGWNSLTGLDALNLQRGVVYEYRLADAATGGTQFSNVDGAMLFTDDPVTTSAVVKRAHFTELRDAVNLLRGSAGLVPFAFDATFTDSAVVRAAHLLALREAAAEARSVLGMTAPVWGTVMQSGIIRAADVQQTRDAVR